MAALSCDCGARPEEIQAGIHYPGCSSSEGEPDHPWDHYDLYLRRKPMCTCGALPGHTECSVCRVPDDVKASVDLSQPPVVVAVPPPPAPDTKPF